MKECDKRKKPYKQQTSYDLYIFYHTIYNVDWNTRNLEHFSYFY